MDDPGAYRQHRGDLSDQLPRQTFPPDGWRRRLLASRRLQRHIRALTGGVAALILAGSLAVMAGGSATVIAAPNARWCPVAEGAPRWARSLRMTVLFDSVLLSGKPSINRAHRCYGVGWRGRPAWMIKHAAAELGSASHVAPLVVIGIGYNSLFQRNRRRYDYWARRWDREAAWMLRVLRRKGAKQFVWVMLREPTPRTVPRYAVRELRYYSWYFPYVNELLRRLDRRRDDVVLANWAKVGDRPGITYDSIHLNSRGGKLMGRLIKRTINREAGRQAPR